jgi:hypothetical protein
MTTETTAAATEDDDEPKVHRLRDMVVEEVSLVDRAANKRRFLIVKRSDEMAEDAEVGTEVKPDGRGGLTAGVQKAKKKPAASDAEDPAADQAKRKKPGGADEGGDTAKARRGAAAEDDDGEADAEKARRPNPKDGEEDAAKARRPKGQDGQADGTDEGDGDETRRRKADGLTMPTPVKEAVLMALTEALERLMSVANRVKEAEETDEQVDAPVPDDVGTEVRAIAELLGGVGESYPSPTAKASVAKAGARMAKDRLDRFHKAMTLLAEILKELSDGREPAPTAGAAEASVRKRDDAAAAAPVSGLTELVAGISELTRVVKRQEEELGKLRQARGVSNAIPVDGARRREPDDVSWPFDMNRPITRDKVKKEVSFFDE